MDPLELRQLERAILTLEVEQLAADHSARARRAHQLADDRRTRSQSSDPTRPRRRSAAPAANGTIATPAAVAT